MVEINVTVLQLAEHLSKSSVEINRRTRRRLHTSCKQIAELAKTYLGHYQGGGGPFPEWAGLLQETVDVRVKRGFPADEPLLLRGYIRDNIKYTVKIIGPGQGEGYVGVPIGTIVGSGRKSDPEYDVGEAAVTHEMGGLFHPQRSFLGLAAYTLQNEIVEKYAKSMYNCVIHPTQREPDESDEE